MATDTEKLKALRDARDKGVKSVRYEDYSAEFRDLDQMDRIIRDLEARVAGGKKPGSKRRFASFSKGL